MKIKIKILTLSIAMLSTASIAHADSDSIKEALSSGVPSIKIESVKKIFDGPIYEVVQKRNKHKEILYVMGDDGALVIMGQIIDLKTGKNLTQERVSEENRVRWSDLHLDNAIKSGSGPLKMAVFSDPECPYCQKFEKFLGSLKGVTVYTFLFPLESIHPDSKRKSISILCSEDPHQEMINVMLLGKATSIELSKVKDCKALDKVNSNIQVGRNLKVFGTPTIISEDGRKGNAILDDEKLKEWLAKK